MARERYFCLHHGARHPWCRCGQRTWAPGLSRGGLEQNSQTYRRDRLLPWQRTACTVSTADRYPGLPAAADAGHEAHPQPGPVYETQPQRPDGGARADQCRPRRTAKRGRHPGMPGRRHTRRRIPRRLLNRAASNEEPVLDTSESRAYAAQRRRYRSGRHIEIRRGAD